MEGGEAVSITLTRLQYDALIYAARAATDANVVTLDTLSLRDDIDKANGITRYFLRVQWIEASPSGPPPALGNPWPPEMSADIELTRPVSRTDVDAVLKDKATQAIAVFVTVDRDGKLGLTALEDYNFYT